MVGPGGALIGDWMDALQEMGRVEPSWPINGSLLVATAKFADWAIKSSINSYADFNIF